jgi:hypothetical protein
MSRHFLALAGFATASTLLLAASLPFPAVLLDPALMGAALLSAWAWRRPAGVRFAGWVPCSPPSRSC